MAEHDSDRERREDGEPDEQHVPFDEDAAWAAIVAGYGTEPTDPPGTKPFKSVEDLALLETGTNDQAGGVPDAAPAAERTESGETRTKDDEPGAGEPPVPLGASVAFAPGIGPRDYSVAEPSEDDFETDDEGHFVPPEPPPLPAADATAKFAWLAVVGGPVLLLIAVLLGWEMTWWLTTLGIGGFIGGFATLVMRMKADDEDDGDPGRGAVV
ncbi:hypothetical protein SZN_07949 [Streptomyces zinciresistens K42]|uniref:Uncharacterized protein n=1 Tax=Streptomyces zinciresistens K42 TaxID=700597 RepID=G2G7X6_9ACTN|nr:hypothetical protein [Streptomyces zinciresistens]EGX60409.1 hypothetical protein SZN_07949 [Streptomyces zinciresistens K42]